MPLTAKGNKIMSATQSEYGAKKGESVFYASRNAGRISGVDPESSGGGGKKKHLPGHIDTKKKRPGGRYQRGRP